MNVELAGVIAEVVGAAAVVISVIYLAIQIRKQTQESRLTATRELCTQFIDFQADVSRDRVTSSIWLKAMVNYEGLEDADRLMASFLIQRGFRSLEQVYLHTSTGNVDGAYFESINGAFKEWLTFPGVKRWWELSNHMFDEKFRLHVENAMEDAASKKYRSSFEKNRANAT